MTRVFDVNGEERSLAWLAQEYDGCHPEFVASRLDMTSYARYFALAAVYVTEGPAVCKVEVRGDAGEPLRQPVCLSWPSLADPDHGLQDLAGSGAPFLWTRRGVAQFTETPTGVTGYGLGSAYGPLYQGWVISPSAPSDCLVGAGMKGGTNHRGPLHAVFQLTATGGAVVDPPATVDVAYARELGLRLATYVTPAGMLLSPEEVADRALEIARLIGGGADGSVGR